MISVEMEKHHTLRVSIADATLPPHYTTLIPHIPCVFSYLSKHFCTAPRASFFVFFCSAPCASSFPLYAHLARPHIPCNTRHAQNPSFFLYCISCASHLLCTIHIRWVHCTLLYARAQTFMCTYYILIY